MCGALFFVAPSHTIILSLYLPPPLVENIPWLVNHFLFFCVRDTKHGGKHDIATLPQNSLLHESVV